MSNESKSSELDRFSSISAAFVSWFTSSNDTRLSPKVHLADLRTHGAGRGVVAIQDIAEDEELFAIPRSLVLCPANSDLPDEVLDSLESRIGWPPLILTMIYEHLHKDTSPWFPYFDLLPTTFDTLMFWSKQELAELQASPVVNKIGKDEAEESWNTTIIPLMLKHPDLFPVQGDDEDTKRQELKRLAHLAGSLIMAYAFDIDSNDPGRSRNGGSEDDSLIEDDEDDPEKGMVPFADMLNADANRNNARLFQEDEYLSIRSIKEILRGEEIFNDYGPLPRSDLLRMYGYVTDNYAQYDVIEISLDQLVEVAISLANPLQMKNLEKFINQINDGELFEDGYTLARPASGAAIDATLSTDFQQSLRALADALEGKSLSRVGLKFDRQDSSGTTICKILIALLTKKVSEYSTSVETDRMLLSELQSSSTVEIPGGVSRHRYEYALQVRIGEKEVCHAVRQLAKEYINETEFHTGHESLKRKHLDDGKESVKVTKVTRNDKKGRR